MLPAIAVAFTQYWPTISALLCAMSVEGGLINIKNSAAQSYRFRSSKFKKKGLLSHFKIVACAQAEEQRQGFSPTMRPIRQVFSGLEIVPLGFAESAESHPVGAQHRRGR